MSKRKAEVFEDRAAFLAAQKGGKKRRSAQEARPNIPRAKGGGDFPAAIKRLTALGFMSRWRHGVGHDFWHLDGRETTAAPDYATAVALAEKEAKQ